MWKAVPEVERREIYVDVQHNLAKKEKEDAKALTKRNKKRLGEILDQVRQVNYIQGDPSAWYQPPVDLDLGCSAILPGQ